MRYVLDTNILIHLIRDSEFWQKIAQIFDLYHPQNQVYISFVSKAEVFALALKNQWGEKRMEKLAEMMENFTVLGINDNLLQSYTEIDAYSQGKHPTKKLPYSALNMGKHDLWIAATAAYIYAELLTTDKDFRHLDGVFLKVHCLAG